jgi:hypothetical protein
VHRSARGLGQRGAGCGALSRVGGAVGGSMLLGQGGAGGGASLTAFISLLGSCFRSLRCEQGEAVPLNGGALSIVLGELLG